MADPYDTLANALTLAATLRKVDAFLNASTDDQTAALDQADDDIDNLERLQGRIYLPTQCRQFPRVAYESPHKGLYLVGGVGPANLGIADTIWDWDLVNNVAIVPPQVLKARIYQANAIIAGERLALLQRQHDGIKDVRTGGMAESYKEQADGIRNGFCLRAEALMRKYFLRAGWIL
jgi:hypothetical protein